MKVEKTVVNNIITQIVLTPLTASDQVFLSYLAEMIQAREDKVTQEMYALAGEKPPVNA